MFGSNKKIELTESVTLSLEEIRLALEVLLGYRIRFVGSISATLGRVTKDAEGSFEQREIVLQTTFVTLPLSADTVPRRLFVQKVELFKKRGANWKVERAFFGFLADDYRDCTWYAAHWERLTAHESQIRVAQDMINASTKSCWFVGTSIADRRTEPLF